MQVLDDGAAGLILVDPVSGSPRLSLAVDQLGAPSFNIHGTDGAKRASLMMLDDGKSGLALFDRAGTRAVLSSEESGQDVGLRFFDQAGKTRAFHGLESDGNSVLRLSFDDANGVTIRAADATDRSQRLAILSLDGSESTTIIGAGLSSSLQLRTKRSKLVLDANEDEASVSASQTGRPAANAVFGVAKGKRLELRK